MCAILSACCVSEANSDFSFEGEKTTKKKHMGTADRSGIEEVKEVTQDVVRLLEGWRTTRVVRVKRGSKKKLYNTLR